MFGVLLYTYYNNFDPVCVYSAGWLLWTQKCRPQFDEFFKGCNGNIFRRINIFYFEKRILQRHMFLYVPNKMTLLNDAFHAVKEN